MSKLVQLLPLAALAVACAHKPPEATPEKEAPVAAQTPSPSPTPATVASLARALRTLHDLPVDTCPFDHRLAVTCARARTAVETDDVDEDDFDAERRGRTAVDLLAELEATRPAAEAAEPHDLVVSHGDACLPNLLVDPSTLRPTGLVDLGRLGVADRHLDLALLRRSITTPDLNEQYGAADAAALVAAYGLARADEGRLAFYRLLDEFF